MKVPEPVNVIFEPSSARADATPPGSRVKSVGGLMLTMSHRTSLLPFLFGKAPPTNKGNSTTALARNHSLAIFMTLPPLTD
jgi:hypothetical protein